MHIEHGITLTGCHARCRTPTIRYVGRWLVAKSIPNRGAYRPLPQATLCDIRRRTEKNKIHFDRASQAGIGAAFGQQIRVITAERPLTSGTDWKTGSTSVVVTLKSERWNEIHDTWTSTAAPDPDWSPSSESTVTESSARPVESQRPVSSSKYEQNGSVEATDADASMTIVMGAASGMS